MNADINPDIDTNAITNTSTTTNANASTHIFTLFTSISATTFDYIHNS